MAYFSGAFCCQFQEFNNNPIDPEIKVWTLFSLLNMYSQKVWNLATGQVSYYLTLTQLLGDSIPWIPFTSHKKSPRIQKKTWGVHKFTCGLGSWNRWPRTYIYILYIYIYYIYVVYIYIYVSIIYICCIYIYLLYIYILYICIYLLHIYICINIWTYYTKYLHLRIYYSMFFDCGSSKLHI